ncbi:pentapeptide repeat protein [Thalassoporum mexicanum PCC 7367]|uniref:pentapeptide repeat-containing protein n=1 Tax=Thalassoporum mexicanum TaxID=3457544 RepID=UPI00029FAE06|nr:pentapeptide repeat-containing protein [Pseudanabaena sp. PCC 7367]AFY68555.1 pentapeptide repeat protein [Pseudanabaena sp. PCC 7367]
MKLTVFIATLCTATIANLTIGAIAKAENPAHVNRLIMTRQCPYCDLYRANLSLANLRGANLLGADMYSVDLKLSDLREANLAAANLYAADLRGADLTGAILAGADLGEAKLCGAIMPDGIKSKEGCPPEKKPNQETIRFEREEKE